MARIRTLNRRAARNRANRQLLLSGPCFRVRYDDHAWYRWKHRNLNAWGAAKRAAEKAVDDER